MFYVTILQVNFFLRRIRPISVPVEMVRCDNKKLLFLMNFSLQQKFQSNKNEEVVSGENCIEKSCKRREAEQINKPSEQKD